MSNIPIATIPGNSTLSDILTNTSFIYMLIFLAIYCVVYFVLGVFYGGSAENNGPLRVIRIIDVIVLLFIVIYIVTTYAYTTPAEFSGTLSNSLSSFKGFADNPFSIFTVLLFLIVFYTVIYFVKIPMTPTLKPVTIMIVETATLILFVGLLIVDFFKYLLNIDLLDILFDKAIRELKNVDEKEEGKKSTDTPKSTCPGMPVEEPGEVFNIRNNLYTYDDAREVCSVYGAKLATYDQIEEAYNKGAEWCNYGWSEGQMALFPTQKSTWNAMQRDKRACTADKVNNACGRPGINGGIIKNPKIRFGVNCYGKKPKQTDADKALMDSNVEVKMPESKQDAELNAKLKVWKENANKFLLVNSFNKKKWSE